MASNDSTVLMEGVRIIFRNFQGKEGMYNSEGERNFSVLLDDDVAEQMARDGWLIKRLKPRELDEEPHAQAYLQVKVSFKHRPPNIVMVTSRGRTNLGEQECEILDWADIENVDLIIRPYEWFVNGKGGIKAYLQSIYVTIREDELQKKYADMNYVSLRPGSTDEPEF
jgi:hypothetical protein